MTPEKMMIAAVPSLGMVVINKGSLDGILSDMEFVVYRDGGEITDPATGKSLGNLEMPKGTFKVMHIQDTMATLITTKKLPPNMHKILRATAMNSDEDEKIRLLNTINVGDYAKVINKR